MSLKTSLPGTGLIAGLSNRFAAFTLLNLLIITTLSINSPAQAPRGNKPLRGDTGSNEIAPEAQLQIRSLLDEKNSRTPAQQKIDSQLIYAGKMRRGESISSAVPSLEVNVGEDENGFVIVDISAVVSPKLLTRLREMGVDVLSSWAAYHTIQARVSLDIIEAIAELPQVRFIQPKQGSTTNRMDSRQAPLAVPQFYSGIDSAGVNSKSRFQAIVSGLTGAGIGGGSTTNNIPNGYNGIGSANAESVMTHGVYSARGIFNTDGAGIKIGVLSNGVVNLAASQGLGDLGPVTVLPGQTGTGDEGTAMLELVHDVAPGAQLYFATANSTPAQFAQNIRDLRTAGCDIIIDDVFYFAESPFQDGQAPSVISPSNGGVITQAVKDVTDAGALFFSSAGNSGNKNDVTSGTWEGDFVSAGTLALVPGGNVHDFDTGVAIANSNLLTIGTGTAPMSLDWSDPLGGSANDYDLFVLNSTLTTVITSATNTQNGTQDPHEQTTVTVAANRRAVVLQKTGAADRFLHLSTNRGQLGISTNGTSYGHSAAANAYSVAAAPAFMPNNFPVAGPVFFYGPYPNLSTTADKTELFTSDGPRRMFYNADGSSITPGNVSSTGGILRQKPDITAADGEQVTGVGGFPTPFYGTSAAAPTAAAIAGLMKAANPALTPAQIRTALTSTALDIEGAGVDPDTGVGMIMAVPSLTAAGLTGRAYLEFNGFTAAEIGNGNSVIEQNEGGTLSINLKNNGPLNATGITATLSTSTPNVTVLQNSSAYTNIGSLGGSAANTTNFTFDTTNFIAPDAVVDFALAINYTGGWNASQVINFKVRLGRVPIDTVLDATAPPTSGAYAITSRGNQTGRLNLTGTGTQSTCAASKPNPGASATGARAYDAYTFTNPLSIPVCTTVTLTEGKEQNDFIFAVAYLGSYDPANPAANYLADWGTSNRIIPMPMSFMVPANATIVVVVVGNTAALTGTPYNLNVSGLRLLSPTAAGVMVTGRVMASGQPVKNAVVTVADSTGTIRTALSNGFGYYQFDNVEVGKTYVFQATAKRHSFDPLVATITEESELNFSGR